MNVANMVPYPAYVYNAEEHVQNGITNRPPTLYNAPLLPGSDLFSDCAKC